MPRYDDNPRFASPELSGGSKKKAELKNPGKPVFTARNIHYEFGDRIGAIAHGGIGAFHLLALAGGGPTDTEYSPIKFVTYFRRGPDPTEPDGPPIA